MNLKHLVWTIAIMTFILINLTCGMTKYSEKLKEEERADIPVNIMGDI